MSDREALTGAGYSGGREKMKREETVKIIRIIVNSYPNYRPADMSDTVDVWHMMLSEYTAEQILTALKAYILSDTSGFAPSIGQLVDWVKRINGPEEPDEMEAWELVSRALRNGYYGAEQEFEKLPPIVQKAVVSPSQLRHWSQVGIKSIESVVQSNFLTNYRIVVNKAKEAAKMPSEIRMILENNAVKLTDRQRHPQTVKEPEVRIERKTIPMPSGYMELLKKELSAGRE